MSVPTEEHRNHACLNDYKIEILVSESDCAIGKPYHVSGFVNDMIVCIQEVFTDFNVVGQVIDLNCNSLPEEVKIELQSRMREAADVVMGVHRL